MAQSPPPHGSQLRMLWARMNSEPQQDHTPGSSWWLLAVLFACAPASYPDRIILSILVDPLRAELHLNDSSIGLLQGLAFPLVYVLASLPLGRAADLFNRK